MGTSKMTEPLYVCVHVPEFSSQALLRLRPELACFPVAVLAGDPPFEQVCSTNPQALRLGVARGMSRAELDSFPGVKTLPRSDMEEGAARTALLEAAGGFTPRVELQAHASAFVMVLDMTGTTLLFGTARETITRLAGSLTVLNLHVQVAASANFQVAVCMAGSARKAPILVPPGLEREHLYALPLSALNLTVQHAETLSLWGLHTLGELAGLPEIELVVRLGQEGRRLRLLARGEHSHLMVPEEPVFTLEEFLAFDAPVEQMESLLFVLGPMLDQLFVRAQNRAFAIASVTAKLGLDGGGQHARIVKPALPVLEREVLLKLLHLDLQAHPPPSGVTSVLLQAEPGDRSKAQLGIFAPQLPEPLRLDVTLARIAALVGEKQVGRAQLLDTHRPDRFTMERFTVSTSPPQAAQARRAIALRRCRPPLNLSVQREGSRPASFFFRGKRYIVREAYGPWQKSGDWWSSERWSCEEWDVYAIADADETLLCLITHDRLHRQWQLKALYD